MTGPQITMIVTDSVLDGFILEKTVFDFENYPLPTLAVERAVKFMSEASSSLT